MKKLILLCLIASAFIFSGCSTNAESETTPGERAEVSDITETGTNTTAENETDSPDPTGTDAADDGRIVYATEYVTVKDEDGETVIYNNDGGAVLLRDRFDDVSELSPGILSVAKDGKKNIFDTSFNGFNNGTRLIRGLMFDRMYDDIEIIENSPSYAKAFVVKDGEIKHPSLNGIVYKEIDCTDECRLINGLLWAYGDVMKCGLYHLNGNNDHYNVIFPCEAEEIICASDGLTNGAVYDNTEPYTERYLFVCQNHKWALYHVSDYYTESAAQLTDYIYDSITRKADGITYAMKGDVQYIIDGNGGETEAEYVTLEEAGGLYIVMYASDPFTHGVVNKSGERIIPLSYRNVEYIDGSFFCGGLKGEYGVIIDKNGNAITTPDVFEDLSFVHGYRAPDNKNTLVIAEYSLKGGTGIKSGLLSSKGEIISLPTDHAGIEYNENDTYTVYDKDGGSYTVNNRGEKI